MQALNLIKKPLTNSSSKDVKSTALFVHLLRKLTHKIHVIFPATEQGDRETVELTANKLGLVVIDEQSMGIFDG